MNDKLVSIIVPMYHEEDVANECYKRLKSTMEHNSIKYELIFVDDGSRDNTLSILKNIAAFNNRVKVISFSRNFGHQIAVTAGINKAKGDAVVIIDADLQDPPELIPRMIELWEKGYEVVYGKRIKRKGESIFKLLTAKLFYRFLNNMTSIDIPLDVGDFRLIDRKVANIFSTMNENNRFIRGMISWIGFRQIPIEYERQERFAGKTKYPLKKMIKFAEDGVISFSSKPLKLIGFLGFLCIEISIFIFLYLIIMKFIFNNKIQAYLPIVMIITFFNGIQLGAVCLLGEYISRIYDESKKRPLYIINEEINIGDNSNECKCIY
ncbi:glycosyltransferase family 2 protein [Clostridium guangxiense]|uniref:glycosyltransferase family 2 protein n=1 Tax=Clostridium guangxiense TaxID=1662055 RepID=UPI001E60F190|nr:glycosyltransferase family 2 protein [Clostridium guangxiense]MCD2345752.1 glycosyltransferase family 2 protein [Clostridium guangxiense]